LASQIAPTQNFGLATALLPMHAFCTLSSIVGLGEVKRNYTIINLVHLQTEFVL